METTFFTKPLSLNFTINFVYMLNIIKGCQWQTSTSKSSNGPAMTEQQKSTKQATNAGSIAGEAGLWPSLRHTRGGRGGPPHLPFTQNNSNFLFNKAILHLICKKPTHIPYFKTTYVYSSFCRCVLSSIFCNLYASFLSWRSILKWQPHGVSAVAVSSPGAATLRRRAGLYKIWCLCWNSVWVLLYTQAACSVNLNCLDLYRWIKTIIYIYNLYNSYFLDKLITI